MNPRTLLLPAALGLIAACGPVPPTAQRSPSPEAPRVAASVAPAAPAPEDPAAARARRLARLVEASARATHAHHVLLARRAGKGDPTCYAAEGRTDADLEALVARQRELFALAPEALRAWADGGGGAPEPHVAALLAAGPQPAPSAPREVMAARLLARGSVPEHHARAIANLFQIVLEVDRDGDILQQVIGAYIALGLPVYLGQLGLPGSDDDLLALGRELAAKTCASPFDVDPPAWQIAARKLWSWGEKKLHVRDSAVVAAELAAEPAVAEILPKLRALPSRKIAVLGHSFTMELHWSSPGSFVQIAGAVLRKEAPQIELREMSAGGLGAAKAEQRFLADLIAGKPDAALLVLLTRKDEDYAALERIGKALREAKIEGYVFDDVMDGVSRERPEVARKAAEVARKAGLKVIEVRGVLEASPERGSFVCLDGIHMKEPYHRVMAREWLRLLAGA